MFAEGDLVRVKATGDLARLLEIADGTAYIELASNGVEMEYPVAAIVLDEEYMSPEQKAALEKAESDAKQYEKEQAILDKLPEIIINFVKGAYQNFPARVLFHAPIWEELNAHQKINWVAVLTQIPAAMWIDGYDNNTLSRLEMVAIINIGKQVKEMIINIGEQLEK